MFKLAQNDDEAGTTADNENENMPTPPNGGRPDDETSDENSNGQEI